MKTLCNILGKQNCCSALGTEQSEDFHILVCVCVGEVEKRRDHLSPLRGMVILTF